MLTWSILISLSIKNMPEIIPDVGPWNKLNSRKKDLLLWFLFSVCGLSCVCSLLPYVIYNVLGCPLCRQFSKEPLFPNEAIFSWTFLCRDTRHWTFPQTLESKTLWQKKIWRKHLCSGKSFSCQTTSLRTKVQILCLIAVDYCIIYTFKFWKLGGIERKTIWKNCECHFSKLKALQKTRLRKLNDTDFRNIYEDSQLFWQ